MALATYKIQHDKRAYVLQKEIQQNQIAMLVVATSIERFLHYIAIRTTHLRVSLISSLFVFKHQTLSSQIR